MKSGGHSMRYYIRGTSVTVCADRFVKRFLHKPVAESFGYGFRF